MYTNRLTHTHMFIHALHINHQNKDQKRNVYTAVLLSLPPKNEDEMDIFINDRQYFLCCFGLIVEIKLAEIFNIP